MLAGTLSVSAGNFIITQPVSHTICKSKYSAKFSLEVDPAFNNYVFRWYRKENSEWKPIQLGGSGREYNATEATEYYCEVTKDGVVEKSNTVSLTIWDVPTITGISAPSVCDGSELQAQVIQVNTNGSNISGYEWILNGITIQNGTVSNNQIPDLENYPVNKSTHDLKTLTLKATNICGESSSSMQITVWATPLLPTPVANDYCQKEPAKELYINDPGVAVWYNASTGGSQIPAPTPDTDKTGTQTWWVSQKVTYPSGPTCESGRKEVKVVVHQVPAPPLTDNNIEMCLNDPSITLQVQGANTTWYNQQKVMLFTAPQINTTVAGIQTFYVTQNNGNCESPKDDGAINILIKERANIEAVDLVYAPELCPKNSTIIDANSEVPNSTFKWYTNNDKTGLIKTGSTLTTPVLMRDTAYYVTVQYEGLCESSFSKAANIFVRDVTLPKITAPPHLVIGTDNGVCYAANVQPGDPLVSDNCTDVSNLIVYNEPTAPPIYNLGDTTIIWWVMDEGGNKYYDLQTISVRDKEKPKGTHPGDIIKEIDEDENSAIITYNLDFTDNCGTVNYELDKGLASGSVFKLGETLVRYFISDDAGNVDTCEFKVIVRHPYRVMDVALRVSSYEICPGQEVIITPIISGGSGKFVYSWEPRVWTDAVMRDYPLRNTTYKLTVDDGLTSQTKTVNVTVLETQQVGLTLEGRSEDEIFEGDEVLVTATSGFSSYKLLLNSKVVQEAGLSNRVSFQAELGIYVVRVFATDVNYCVAQDQLTIEVDSRKLPNFFSPNKDGKNDIFLEGFDLMIFSRAGELLYKGLDGWDGTYKGKLMPQGTYLYVVRRTMNNGEERIFKGTVTLKL